MSKRLSTYVVLQFQAQIEIKCCNVSYSVLQLSVMKRKTWTFDPDNDVKSLVSKEITRRVGKNGDRRGKRTEIIHEAIRKYLASLNGKREAAINGK
jgi:hypothetical protein